MTGMIVAAVGFFGGIMAAGITGNWWLLLISPMLVFVGAAISVKSKEKP